MVVIYTRPTRLDTYLKAWGESKKKKEKKYWSKTFKKELKKKL